MTSLPPPSGDTEKLVLALEHLGETLKDASMSYGASVVAEAISCIHALEADHKAMRECLTDLWDYYAPEGKGFRHRYPGGLSELERCERVLSSLKIHE